jgi:hypothetical protein
MTTPVSIRGDANHCANVLTGAYEFEMERGDFS